MNFEEYYNLQILPLTYILISVVTSPGCRFLWELFQVYLQALDDRSFSQVL